ncbi:hypothetical protein L195_g010008, partial [Trifolium pratense]
ECGLEASRGGVKLNIDCACKDGGMRGVEVFFDGVMVSGLVCCFRYFKKPYGTYFVVEHKTLIEFELRCFGGSCLPGVKSLCEHACKFGLLFG